MFFEDWADRIGNNDVKYSTIDNSTHRNHIIKIDFVNEEDATIMRLKGIPDEFQKYLKFADCPMPETYTDCIV